MFGRSLNNPIFNIRVSKDDVLDAVEDLSDEVDDLRGDLDEIKFMIQDVLNKIEEE